MLEPKYLEEISSFFSLMGRSFKYSVYLCIISNLLDAVDDDDTESRPQAPKKRRKLFDDILLEVGVWSTILKRETRRVWRETVAENIQNDQKKLKRKLKVVHVNLKLPVMEIVNDARRLGNDAVAVYDNAFYELKSKWDKFSSGRKKQEILRSFYISLKSHPANWDVMAKRHLTDMMNQACGKMTILSGMQAGYDMLCTTTHMGARNKGTGPENHEQWQGKPGRITDRQALIKMLRQDYLYDAQAATNYPVPAPDDANEELDEPAAAGNNLREEQSKPDVPGGVASFVEMTGLGTPVGLYGYNCRHSVFIYDPEADNRPRIPKKQTADFTYSGEDYTLYEMSQLQRRAEAGLREKLFELEELRAVKAPVEMAEAEVYAARERIKKICKISGLPRMYDNEKIFIRK
jgi:hypothetical protein